MPGVCKEMFTAARWIGRRAESDRWSPGIDPVGVASQTSDLSRTLDAVNQDPSSQPGGANSLPWRLREYGLGEADAEQRPLLPTT